MDQRLKTDRRSVRRPFDKGRRWNTIFRTEMLYFWIVAGVSLGLVVYYLLPK